MSGAAIPPLVDTHAHLQDPVFDGDRHEVIARAFAAGLKAVVCVGYDLDSSRRAVELAARHESIYAAVGIHPNSVGDATDEQWREIRVLAAEPKVVGIGETGLDNYRQHTLPRVQESWLERHLELARERDLPVVIHNREADRRMFEILQRRVPSTNSARPPGVMHCFSGNTETLESSLALGFVISFAGPVTFKNAASLQAVAKIVPGDRFVVETDSPYLTPHPYRGTRNEPAYVQYTARQMAELRGEPFDELAERTSRTAAHLFRLNIAVPSGADSH
jgi:TatD DNase family protein